MIQLNQHLQDSILRLAITDTEFIKQIHGQLEPKHLTSRLADNLLGICYGFYEVSEKAPKDHFQDELFRFCASLPEDDVDEHVLYAQRLGEIHQPNRAYVINRLGDFIRARVREEAHLGASDLLQDGKLDEYDNMMYEALRSGSVLTDDGINYTKDTKNVGRPETSEVIISTGIPAMDKLVDGFRRGELIVTLGGYKAGKTFWLSSLGIDGLSRGRNVLQISHEVPVHTLEARYDMALTMRATKHIGEIIDYWAVRNGEPEQREIALESIYTQEGITAILKARRTIDRLGGSLRLKKYAMGQCTCAEIERYIHYLEAHEGWTPDVLLIDYIDIMDLTPLAQDYRHQLNRAYIWAKGLADRLQIVVATVSQVTTSALEKRRVSQKDVSEDRRKVGNCDLMFAIGRSKDDVKNGMAAFNVLASRGDRQGGHVMFSPCFDVGRFAMASWMKDEITDEIESHGDAHGDTG